MSMLSESTAPPSTTTTITSGKWCATTEQTSNEPFLVVYLNACVLSACLSYKICLRWHRIAKIFLHLIWLTRSHTRSNFNSHTTFNHSDQLDEWTHAMPCGASEPANEWMITTAACQQHNSHAVWWNCRRSQEKCTPVYAIRIQIWRY